MGTFTHQLQSSPAGLECIQQSPHFLLYRIYDVPLPIYASDVSANANCGLRPDQGEVRLRHSRRDLENSLELWRHRLPLAVHCVM
jgi:hypothetical protein